MMLTYFDHELVEMKTRPNAEGHAFFISRYFSPTTMRCTLRPLPRTGMLVPWL